MTWWTNVVRSSLFVRERSTLSINRQKIYLATGNGRRIFRSSKAEEHGTIMHRSLDLMANTLRKDICNLKKPGALAREAEQNVSIGLLPRIVVFKTPNDWRFCHPPPNMHHLGRGQPKGVEFVLDI
jgi:hypothetical protein